MSYHHDNENDARGCALLLATLFAVTAWLIWQIAVVVGRLYL